MLLIKLDLEGLDKTIPNYQEECVIKLLKEIRDNLAGLPMLPGPPGPPSPPSSPSPPPPPPRVHQALRDHLL